MTSSRAKTPEASRSVAIACQGGGSHTAFTAGVLSRLFDADELARYRIVGLSGTSGGAVCALLAWSALLDDDRARAGRVLEEFWVDNGATGLTGWFLNATLLAASTAQSFGLLPAVSPYHLPTTFAGLDQFRQMLRRHVDFERITLDSKARHPMLLLGAVDVRSGRFRAFNSRRDRITEDCVLASAAIPTLFPAIPVDGGLYWDGLFSQNPPVRDLLDADPDELWVIQVNPRERATEPTTLLDIADRRNELSGNLSLYQELGFIETIDRLLEDGLLGTDGKYRQVVVRVIEMPRAATSGLLGPTSKLNRDPAFLDDLMAQGRKQADVFLAALAFERAWAARDADAVLQLLAEHASLESRAPFAPRGASRDPLDVSAFVAAALAEGITIDPVRKQIAGDQVSWSIRMRSDFMVLEGTVSVEIVDGVVVSLRLGPTSD